MHIFHKWDKWSNPKMMEGNYVLRSPVSGIVLQSRPIEVVYQTRVCKVCGKWERKEVDSIFVEKKLDNQTQLW